MGLLDNKKEKSFAMACAKHPLAVVYYLTIISWSIMDGIFD